MPDVIAQAVIVVCGVSAVHLAASRTRRGRRLAGVLGLAAQPAWIYTTLANEQYAITALCALYAWGWLRTVRNNLGGDA